MAYIQIHKGFAIFLLGVILIALIFLLLVNLTRALNHQKFFENCTQLKAAGIHDIPKSSPYYRPGLDRDGNGIACQT